MYALASSFQDCMTQKDEIKDSASTHNELHINTALGGSHKAHREKPLLYDLENYSIGIG